MALGRERPARAAMTHLLNDERHFLGDRAEENVGKHHGSVAVSLRRRRAAVGQPEPAEKVEPGSSIAADAPPEASIVPARVRIELEGGRADTATVLRAVRLLREIEGTGGIAAIAEVAQGRSALFAEVDGAQAASLARLPFVRRIHVLKN